MTRVLSELLGAETFGFHRNREKLESASGHNSTDIRLTSEINLATKSKLKELGLDPHDTTGEELYHALQEHFRADDEHLQTMLERKFGVDGDTPVSRIAKAIESVPLHRSSYGLKSTVAKKLLKKSPPKKTMKQLGYRSFDSMLKHEHAASIFAAAEYLESAAWLKQLHDSYKKLKPSDFEIRQLQVLTPDTKKWQSFGDELIAHHKHNVVALKELGAVVLMPLPAKQPAGATTTTLLLALQAMNEIRAASTFLKLCQVKPQFGQIVLDVVKEDAVLEASSLDQAVPWQIIQRYYARFTERFRADLFEPHIQMEDLSWHSVEKVLAHIDPSLEFWKHTTHLSLLDAHHDVISFNIIDVALSFCNELPYGDRIVQYFRNSLWHELFIRYLKHESVEQSVLTELQADLVPAPAVK